MAYRLFQWQDAETNATVIKAAYLCSEMKLQISIVNSGKNVSGPDG
jgi:hypothetical protein